MSDAWIFPLYVYLLIGSSSWYKRQTVLNSIALGIVLGLGVICRPTEIVMILVPFFWDKDGLSLRAFITKKITYILIVLLPFTLIVFIQLYYWKYVTGNWMYDVGSKWDFLNPHWKVLIGEEKGWLIYTPICILMLWGLKYIKHLKFSNSIIIFICINIWIIISWHVWRYGASCSTRALIQSYPIMMFPLLASIKVILENKWKHIAILLFCYFLALNLFQVYQYNAGILHCDRNTFKYYKKIYWKRNKSENDIKYLQKIEK
jgi:hypothetical protein